MKIVIFCDMEGISGVWHKDQVKNDAPGYREACGHMTRDANACIRGCVDAGAKEIIVRDVHNQCNNIIWEDLDHRADYLVTGDPGMNRFDCLDKCDGLILLGYHAMAGTPGAILSHTATTAWHNCWLNGKKAGEFALDAARAGEYGVPVIMASGDGKLCAEARSFSKNVVTVQVKEGRARESGKLLAAEKALKKIHDGAMKA
ncbi:MAG: aminopeptidase, partial [Clostridia bacterium]|nr:aminopeptidase [Clostridia bacterium]